MAHVKKKQLICEVKSLDGNGFQYFCLQCCGKFPSVVEYIICLILSSEVCCCKAHALNFFLHEANPLFVGASSYLVIYFRGKLISLFVNL